MLRLVGPPLTRFSPPTDSAPQRVPSQQRHRGRPIPVLRCYGEQDLVGGEGLADHQLRRRVLGVARRLQLDDAQVRHFERE